MLKAKALRTATIYVPTKRRTTLDPVKVAEIAESILEKVRQPRSWFAKTVIGSFWLRACIASKHASHSARRRSWLTSSKLGGTNRPWERGRGRETPPPKVQRMAEILALFALDAVYGAFLGRGQIDANGSSWFQHRSRATSRGLARHRS
jgi:hypothetical protein